MLAVGVAVIALALATGVPSGAAPSPFGLADLAREVGIAAPQISPDGRRAVAVISRIDSDHDRTDDEVEVIDLATGAHRALAFNRSGVAASKWSPDGRRITFIADSGEGESAHPQVVVMPLDGGDARAITTAPEGVESFSWRPDGTAVTYAAVDPPPKRTGSARFIDAHEVGNGSYLLPGAARPFRIWLQPVGGGPPELLTPGNGSVTSGEAASTLSFSPDGTRLAYLWAPDAILNDADFAVARVVDVAARRSRRVSAHLNRERDAQFAPDGTQVTYLYSDGDSQSHPQEAYVTSAGGGEDGGNVWAPADQYAQSAGWQPHGTTLSFSSVVQTQAAIWRVARGEPPRRVDIGDLCAVSPLTGAIGSDGTLVFVGSASAQPPDLYVRTPGSAPRKLTDYNAAIAARRRAASERVTFPTSLGIDGDGVLIEPPGFNRGRRYPLVVVIHGGPTDASTQSFDDFGQLLAARGWLVLEPNYRGSDNLGRTYLASIFDDVSTGPGRDIMAAVDAVRAMGIVDPARIAVWDWSYGGVMTTWMITHHRIWKAAVAGAPVTDRIADYATADDLDTGRYLFGGSPLSARTRARWVHEEAITYVSDVTTPVLLLADRGDARVANVSLYEFFHALRDLGKPVRFIVYPVDGHFPHDPARTADVYARWMNHIGDYFKL